jgi:hypothetical protein
MRNLISISILALIALPVFGEALPEAPVANFSSSRMSYRASTQSTNLMTEKAPVHHFFEKSNNIRFAALAGLVAADGFTTQVALSGNGQFREMNPIARPFVNHGAAGQVAASVIGLGASTGTAYLLHKTGHHKLERMLLNASIGIEAETVTSNSWQLLR